MSNWSDWMPMPSPENARKITGPLGAGVYQIRNKLNNQLIQFGESKNCQKRMQSLFPKPYGLGTRNNESKRKYILEFWKVLEYRTLEVKSKEEAVKIDRELKAQNNHLFNT